MPVLLPNSHLLRLAVKKEIPKSTVSVIAFIVNFYSTSGGERLSMEF